MARTYSDQLSIRRNENQVRGAFREQMVQNFLRLDLLFVHNR